MGCKRYWALTGIALTVLSAQGMAMAETATPAPASAPASATGGAQADQPVFVTEQIEQMVAPIALYPDALLAQVLMAATYPLEIVQASRWVKQHPDLKDEALDAALREESWDPSVKTLVLLPDVLKRLNDNLDWTQDLGDAFLAQEGDVMAAVQRLRREAQQTGALKDTTQQKVVVEKETIVVETADPQVVYVPTFDPSVVYGTPPPATQYYPTVYQQPVYTSSAADQWVSFGTGALVGGLLTAAIMWDDDDDDWYDGWGYRHHIWHHGDDYWDRGWRGPRYGSGDWNRWRGDVNIDGDVCIGRCINIDRNEWKKQARTFEHRPEHRGGVRYKDLPNVAARHPGVATTLPAKLDQRPGRPGVSTRRRSGRIGRASGHGPPSGRLGLVPVVIPVSDPVSRRARRSGQSRRPGRRSARRRARRGPLKSRRPRRVRSAAPRRRARVRPSRSATAAAPTARRASAAHPAVARRPHRPDQSNRRRRRRDLSAARRRQAEAPPSSPVAAARWTARRASAVRPAGARSAVAEAAGAAGVEAGGDVDELRGH